MATASAGGGGSPERARPKTGDPEVAHLEREVEEGNREYKWKLVRPSAERIAHLTTQMNWRLNESPHGEAVYMLGVRDDGFCEGISDTDMRESLKTLKALAKGNNAAVKDLKVQRGVSGKVAEVLIRREECRITPPVELRVAVLGPVDSGKSTLVGVLTKGSLDNGRGLARMKVFRHNHEVANGRTSSIVQHMMGFDQRGAIVNYGSGLLDASPLSAEEVMQRSRKVVSFIDLAGHEKYLKTTLSGMVGLAPDHAMLSISALPPEGCGGADAPLEHLHLALALDVPLSVVLTKVDMASEEMASSTLASLTEVLGSVGRRLVVVSSAADLCSVASAADAVPIFLVSNVTGVGLELLRTYIRDLPRRALWDDARHEPTEVHLDDSFDVDGVGRVLAGTIRRGRVQVGDTVLLGPDRATGAFHPVVIRSMHVNRVSVRAGHAGQCVTLALQGPHEDLPCGGSSSPRKQFKGAVLLSPTCSPSAVYEFDAHVVVLCAPEGALTAKHEPVVHAHTTRQSAKILRMSQGSVGKGEAAVCTFRFRHHAEYLAEGMTMLLRGGRTLGIGRVVAVR